MAAPGMAAELAAALRAFSLSFPRQPWELGLAGEVLGRPREEQPWAPRGPVAPLPGTGLAAAPAAPAATPGRPRA
eukprot:8995253-Lingulodinium_polyedra.AAC.1